ncbi:MAG: AraC-like DNA-binding protein [Halieaceae bacterium]|jgi:AraC-like DNA-binding protein
MIEYMVRASVLDGYRELVASLDGDANALLSASGVTTAPLQADDWIAYSSFLTLLELSAKTLNCQHFGLLLSREQGINVLGPVGFVMAQAPDIRTALAELSKYFAHHNQGAYINLTVDDGLARWSFESRIGHAFPTIQQSDLAMGIGINIMSLLCGSQWAPKAAYSTRSRPENIRPFRELLRCPIYYDWEGSWVTFNADILDLKISQADSNLHRILKDHLALVAQSYPNNYSDQIKHLIQQAILTGDCSVDSVASYLSITKRTLQRRLKANGASYRDLLEDVRVNMAKRYLKESSSSITALSDMLGYSEVSAFSNAFKISTGESPRAWVHKQHSSEPLALL